MHGATSDSHAAVESVLRTVVARKGRQQRWMHVDDASRKPLQERRTEKTHEPRKHDQTWVEIRHLGSERFVPKIPIVSLAKRHDAGRDAPALGELERCCALAIGHDPDDVRTAHTLVDGGTDGPQVGSATRNENDRIHGVMPRRRRPHAP
jgi:hypothetical protein